MPLYEYQCRGCAAKREILQRVDEVKKPRCEECGKGMKKVISTSAFILKGSGWYVTDYPSKSRKEGMESEKKAQEKKKEKKKEKPSSGKTASSKEKGKKKASAEKK